MGTPGPPSFALGSSHTALPCLNVISSNTILKFVFHMEQTWKTCGLNWLLPLCYLLSQMLSYLQQAKTSVSMINVFFPFFLNKLTSSYDQYCLSLIIIRVC